MTVLDVRNIGEFENGHIAGAVNIPLGVLESRISELESDRDYLVHCAGGYRSMIGASIMKRHRFDRIINVRGGYGKLKLIVPELIETLAVEA
jgi:hydroxyacylglutathione hydrolase